MPDAGTIAVAMSGGVDSSAVAAMLRADGTKDQTYFLFGLTQDQLAHTLFPLGEMEKPVVRAKAAEAGLALAQKPDSQEICFIPGGSYSNFLRAYLNEQDETMPDSAG